MGERKQASFNIHDYVSQNTQTLDESGFNTIDGLILTQISNMDLGDIGIDLGSGGSKTFSELYQYMQNTTKGQQVLNRLSEDNRKLLEELAKSPRFQAMSVSDFVCDPVKNGIEGFPSVGKDSDTEQFAAVTITYTQNGETIHYMSFRATDGSTDGWNEDLLMITSECTQAQQDSVVYMNYIGRHKDGILTGGGHSKGGNDFEYGYLFCDEEVRRRIEAGYLYDSPGLHSSILQDNPYYREFQEIIRDRFICPQDSVVGMLLHENDNPQFVHSVEEGVNEHDPYSWEIDPESMKFVPDSQTQFSIILNEALDRVVNEMSPEERDAFFAFVSFLLYHNGGEGLDGLTDFFSKDWMDEDGNLNKGKLLQVLATLAADYHFHLTPEQQESLKDAIGTTFSALSLYGVEKVLDCLEDWLEEKKRQFQAVIQRTVSTLVQWGVEKWEQLQDFFNGVYESFCSCLQRAASYILGRSSGSQYAENNPLIQVDTQKLRSYAQQLQNINRKLSQLDRKMDSLYWKVGFLDLWNLIQADLFTGYSWRLSRCISYLNETASDFEQAENSVRNSL